MNKVVWTVLLGSPVLYAIINRDGVVSWFNMLEPVMVAIVGLPILAATALAYLYNNKESQ